MKVLRKTTPLSTENEANRYNLVQMSSGLSKKDFAESIGISKAMGYQISTGIIKPSRANAAYEPRRYTGHELEDIKVAGRVVACYHRV